MGYVDDHLLPGEQVAYRAHLHRIVYAWPVVFALVMAAASAVSFVNARPVWGVMALVLGAVPLVWRHVLNRSSEFAVTNKRVIVKVGWIRRRTVETMLNNVEAIGVDQTISGRILDFGTITITGTGGTKEPFRGIARPLEFRRQVQGQISLALDSMGSRPVVPASVPVAARDERDCPHCAERILARARVCKHCGRDVEPLIPLP